MARIESDYDIAGTYGNLVVYKVGDQLYARTKSSLDGKRFWKDRAFARSREKAKQFGVAAMIAKTIYALLPKEVKRYGLFGKVTGFIHKGLQEGKSKETLVQEMREHLGIIPPVSPLQVAKPARPATSKKVQRCLSTWQVTAEGLFQPIRLTELYSHKQREIPLLWDG